MEIKYCNSEKLEQGIEDELRSVAKSVLDQNTEKGCSHESIEISICINDPLNFYTKGYLACLECKAKFGFTGNVSEPLKEFKEL